MSNFNENNPTVNWTEDEKYEVCKWENKWLKELTRVKGRRISGRVCDSVDDPTFATTEELNKTFQNYIEDRKRTWRHLCPICDYASNTKSVLTTHLTVHGIGERLKCDQCDKDYSRKAELRRHIEWQHTLAIQIPCTICKKTFARKLHLKNHMKIHNPKTIPCDKCSKMFGTAGGLNLHKRTVHIFKSFKCYQCNNKYKTLSALNIHIRTVHIQEKFSCNLCDHVATKMSNLKVHKESIHEEKKHWFCKACSYSCYAKFAFIIHMRIHTGEKPFQCNKCLSRFRQIHNLRRHKDNCTSLLLKLAKTTNI